MPIFWSVREDIKKNNKIRNLKNDILKNEPYIPPTKVDSRGTSLRDTKILGQVMKIQWKNTLGMGGSSNIPGFIRLCTAMFVAKI